MTAIQISDLVWVVGTPEPGSANTSQFDCVQYLVWDGTDGILIDVGTGLGCRKWQDNIESVCGNQSPSGALITHYHGDHAGGAQAAAQLGHALWGSELTASAIAIGDETVTQVRRARELGIYPAGFSMTPTPGVRVLHDFEQMQLGGIAVTVVNSPGHCDGHFVYLIEADNRRMLFSGDVIFAQGKISMQATPDCRLDLYADTVIGIAELQVDELYPGHGEPVLCRASEDIASAAASFARLVPPPNLLN